MLACVLDERLEGVGRKVDEQGLSELAVRAAADCLDEVDDALADERRELGEASVRQRACENPTKCLVEGRREVERGVAVLGEERPELADPETAVASLALEEHLQRRLDALRVVGVGGSLCEKGAHVLGH